MEDYLRLLYEDNKYKVYLNKEIYNGGSILLF